MTYPRKNRFASEENAAKFLDLSVKILKRLRALDRGPLCHRFPTRVLYDLSGLEDYKERRRTDKETQGDEWVAEHWVGYDELPATWESENDTRLVGTRDAARILDISVSTLSGMRTRWRGPPYYRYPRVVLYDVRDLQVYMSPNTADQVRLCYVTPTEEDFADLVRFWERVGGRP